MRNNELYKKVLGKYGAMKDLQHYLTKNHKPGDQLPSERELNEVVGWSRPTIRECLARMECFGIISIRQGKPNIFLGE